MTRPLLLLLSLVLTSSMWAASPFKPTEVSVFVVLEGEPLAAQLAEGGVRPAVVIIAPPDRKQEIAQQQAAVERELVALGGQVTDRFDTLLNALVVKIATAQLPAVRKLAGVKSVRLERHFERNLETSVPWIGAPAGWSLSTGPWTGENIRLAIVDSGIDYLHADFGGGGNPDDYANNDPTRIETGTFPTARVVGGTDFVGDDYDSRGEDGSPTPRPDPDPLDTVANGHGTHVAGIAAGGGVLTNGVAYTGPYNSSLDFTQFTVAPGVAPRAKLLSFKVFGSAGSTSSTIIVNALERCLDPNRDGNFSDHVDVVNLSLGSPFGIMDGSDPEAEAIDRLVNQGIIVAVSAGNSGNTFYVLGSPGIANRAITVANSLDDGASFSTIKVVAPAAVAGDYTAVEGVFTAKLDTHGPVTAQVVQTEPALACDPLRNTAALQGKIALVDRGTCFFVDKVRAVQTAGAVGVIVVNNVDGPPFEMGGRGDTSDIIIPGVMISQRDGGVLKGQLNNGLTVTLDAFAAVARPELADQLSDSSSRGPGAGQNRLKPDISAPGTSIFSAKAGTGTDGTLQTGTSMSAPHVAGAAALMRQAHPTWTVEDIKAAMMNTSTSMQSGSGVPYPETRKGAGRLQVDAALRTSVVARADTGNGDVSVSFGAFELAEPFSVSRNIRVVNQGAIPTTLRLSSINTGVKAGVTVTPSVTSVTVPGRSSAVVGIRLDIDPAQLPIQLDGTSSAMIGDKARYFMSEASGQVWITNATQRLHVPWHVAARPTTSFRATANRVGVAAGQVSAVSLPTRGTTAHPQPVASVFQLGFSATSPGATASDLVAVGATSDYALTHDLSRTQLYFGLATGGKWATPQYELIGLEVEIDTNSDGEADLLILNASGGNLNGQGVDPDLANDALLSLVADFSLVPGDFFVSSAPLNVLTPEFRDTAAFQNRVLVHSAAASSLGLTAGRSKFKYRVTATDSIAGGQTDSGWIDFDATAPVIDPTPYGLLHSPFFDEGGSVRVDVSRSAATAGGFTTANPPRALILHQQGAPGRTVDIVTLDLGTADTDGDGLPDAWEMEQIGDLASNGSSDPDHDGRTNAAEFAAGTNPLETRMLLPLPESGTLRWLGSVGRTYTLERASHLTGNFEAVFRRVVGVDGTNSIVDPELLTGDQAWFYRVRPE
ncbi:MAG TPA: S8 family serine peptidase [Verrucomicrobiota bacterium]|nr:S8 family serine peptidase [Verrucomicrobiota bacterium]